MAGSANALHAEGYVIRVPQLRPPGVEATATHLDSRKTKSAEVERPGHGPADMDELRPSTSSSAASASSGSSRISRSKGTKKQGKGGQAAASMDLPMDGWGDFDSDRLFRGELPVTTNDGSEIRRDGKAPETAAHETMEERVVHQVDGEGESLNDDPDSQPRSQRQRLEELARRANKPSSQSHLLRELPKQVLRQRTLAVMELEAPEVVVDAANGSPNRTTTQKKSLVSYRRAKKGTSDSERETSYLPKIKKGSAMGAVSAMSSPHQAGLLGPHIEDSVDARTQVFERFLPVWSLMSSRGVSSFVGNGLHDPDSHTNGVSHEAKSPFECSMVLMKICKTIGISLSTSPAPDVWSCVRKRSGRPKSEVEFESFCDFVVRNAVQPALHHFRLDRDMDEYVHTMDAVIHSLLVKDTAEHDNVVTSHWRIRELTEIQAVLPHWKKGILAVQRQNPLMKTSPSIAIIPPDAVPVVSDDDLYSAAIVSADEAQYYPTAPSGAHGAVSLQVTVASVPRPKKLPAHEARIQQDANIRRKIQLRKSWQSRVAVAEPQSQQQHQGASLESGDVDSDPDRADALGSCMRVEAMMGVPNNLLEDGSNSTLDQAKTSINNNDEGDPEEEIVLLLCGSCDREEEATLWCSACFAVYCDACWTSTHHSVVDMAMAHSAEGLLAPSARPMRTNRDRENNQTHHKPPVEIVYLPTKPLVVGKRLRGSISVYHKATNQEQEPVSREVDYDSGEETKQLSHSFSSQAILPAIRPAYQPRGLIKKKLSHHQSAPTLDATPSEVGLVPSSMDSTANLLKALMLGTVSSASVLGSSTTSLNIAASSTTNTTATRTYKDPVKRKKLHPAPVTLDVNAIFQSSH